VATRTALTGNYAVARAMKQIKPDVVAAYPITPQTDVVEEFSQFVADGLVPTEFVPCESEHSAMSTCIGAAAAGARVMTATSSQGLALMWEMLYIASGYRLPIVMALANRALSGPINIHCDHSDGMGARDSGWIQIYCKNQQEAYDTMLQAVRIAEHPDVLTPVMVCYDGFVVSHAMASVELLDDDQAAAFVGTYTPKYPLLDTKHPVTYGPLVLFDYYHEMKRQQVEGILSAPPVIEEVGRQFGDVSGRYYGLVEPYRLDDAEVAVVALGSAASTCEVVVDELRDAGVAAGSLRVRAFQPFPRDLVAKHLDGKKAVAVMDRAESFGARGGPLCTLVEASLYRAGKNVPVVNYIYGLGGRDTTTKDIHSVYDRIIGIARGGEVGQHYQYLSVRGGDGNGRN